MKQGGGVAAPIGSQIFGEVLPYLEVTKDGLTEDESQITSDIQVPNIEGKSIKEAENILKENNLKMIINNIEDGMDKENNFVKAQIPKPGVNVKKDDNIYIDW